MLQDLRGGIRALKQAPRLTGFAVLSLALGIGINTTVFTFVNALQFRPLPYADPDRLVNLHEERATELCQGCAVGTSYPGYLDWLEQVRSYKQVAAYTDESFVVSGRGEPARVGGAAVSGSFFQVLGVRPALGRALLPDDDRAGAAAVVVISHGFAQRLFGGEEARLKPGTTTIDHGVTSYSAIQRTHEIGIRIALGASSSDIRTLMLKQGSALACLGMVAGLAGAAALTRVIRAVLVGTSPTDPVVFTTTSLLLAGVAIAAAYLPARGASGVDPLVALRD